MGHICVISIKICVYTDNYNEKTEKIKEKTEDREYPLLLEHFNENVYSH